jgi:hypothetical protein
MANPPTRQGKSNADQNVHQEEEYQVQVKLGMHKFCLL